MSERLVREGRREGTRDEAALDLLEDWPDRLSTAVSVLHVYRNNRERYNIVTIAR